ncbi:GntR family transcriptional regulator [Pseudorhodoplanes sp.]|uniref:GntR family transcriptional regulator n=1 Tax=Pseudorhodoplanes sp. TaxID=1934341 RepID=UPI003D0C02AA
MSDRSINRKTGEDAQVKVLKAVSLREQIYEHLRERIRTGQLTFEDRLVDVDIASEFGVSRMPVREALMQLVHDGAIESTTRGFVLRRFSDREIEDIFAIRRLLEPAAAAGAATNMSAEALEQMLDALEQCERADNAGDSTAFILANARFRGAWIGQVPNRQLAAAILRFSDHVQAVRLKTLPSVIVRQDVVERMRAILAAFQREDAEAVASLVETHVMMALQFFRKPAPA